MKNYEDMLKDGLKNVPKTTVATTRFEAPRAKSMIQGNKTIITNIFEVANKLRREPKHLIKFLSLELATSYDVKDNKVFYIGNFTPDHVNKKIDSYIKAYVLCKECDRPDTKLVNEGDRNLIKCEACGAKYHIKKV